MQRDAKADPVRGYVAAVLAGEIVAGELVRLACERHLRDLEDGAKRGLRFDPAAAERGIKFFSFLRHSKGKEWGGRQFTLEPWESFIIGSLFGWKKKDGRRRFKVAYVEVAKKNGKSTLAAGLGLELFIADGEPGAEIYCLAPETRILTAEFHWKPVGHLRLGERLIAFDANPPSHNKMRKLRSSAVKCIDRKVLPCCRITFEDGREIIASSEHRWLARTGPDADRVYWLKTKRLRPGARIRSIGMPWREDLSKESGYLAGIFDGEACFHQRRRRDDGEPQRDGFRIGFAQKPGEIMSYVKRLCEKKGFRVSPYRNHSSGADYFEISGFYQCARFLGQIRPKRLLRGAMAWCEGKVPNRNPADANVKAVEFVGNREVVAISTETETLFAEGLFSHNTAATKRDQARIVHGEAIRMVRATPALAKRVKIFKDNLNILATNSKYEPLGKDHDSTDGINPHGVIVDELHRHKSRDMLDLMDNSGAARSQPLLLMITTAGTDKRTICGEQRDYTERILRGIVEDDSYFAYVATLDEADDWTDPANFIKANPNLGVSVKMDEMIEKRDKALKIPAYQNAFRRYRLNQWLQQADRYIPMDDWNACAGVVDPEPLKGKEAYGGLDLANTIDIAAFVLLFAPEGLSTEEIADSENPQQKLEQIAIDQAGQFFLMPFFFIPEENIEERGRKDGVPYDLWVKQGLIETTPGNIIDYDWIKKRILALSEVYKFSKIGFDPWNATQFATQLQETHGFEMIQVRQGYQSMSEPTKTLLRLVLARKLSHSGNSVLRWMADNLVVRMDPNQNVRPDKDKSSQKIDGIVAAIMALALAIREIRKRSVYETRGVLTLPGI